MDEYVVGFKVVAGCACVYEFGAKLLRGERLAPPSKSLSNICLSTSLLPLRLVMRDWYVPSCAVAGEPMTKEGPLSVAALDRSVLEGVNTAVGDIVGSAGMCSSAQRCSTVSARLCKRQKS